MWRSLSTKADPPDSSSAPCSNNAFTIPTITIESIIPTTIDADRNPPRLLAITVNMTATKRLVMMVKYAAISHSEATIEEVVE